MVDIATYQMSKTHNKKGAWFSYFFSRLFCYILKNYATILYISDISNVYAFGLGSLSRCIIVQFSKKLISKITIHIQTNIIMMISMEGNLPLYTETNNQTCHIEN